MGEYGTTDDGIWLRDSLGVGLAIDGESAAVAVRPPDDGAEN